MSLVRKKITVVGDGYCGKTCLALTFIRKAFPHSYVPTVFETYVADIKINNKDIELSIWDTAGQEDYDRPDSLYNVREKWLPEVRHFCPLVPIVLVGTKNDLRQDSYLAANLKEYNQTLVSWEEGKQVADAIGAFAYLECSAMKNDGVNDVFITCAKASMTMVKRKRFCTII